MKLKKNLKALSDKIILYLHWVLKQIKSLKLIVVNQWRSQKFGMGGGVHLDHFD